MKLRDGRECSYYFADYYRRSSGKEKCSLLEGKDDAKTWNPDLCRTCPVPDFQRANSCPNMYYVAKVAQRGWQFWRSTRMKIQVYCKLSRDEVTNPMVGCGQCHAPISFTVSDDDHLP